MAFEDDGIRKAKLAGVACVEFIEDVDVGLKMAFNFKLLRENSTTAIEFAEEERTVPLRLLIKHPNFLEPPFILNNAHLHSL